MPLFPIEVSRTTFAIAVIGSLVLLWIAYSWGFFSGLKTPIATTPTASTK